MDPMIMIYFREKRDIIEKIKAQAEAEGTSISTVIRRALRRELLLLPSLSTSEHCPQSNEKGHSHD